MGKVPRYGALASLATPRSEAAVANQNQRMIFKKSQSPHQGSEDIGGDSTLYRRPLPTRQPLLTSSPAQRPPRVPVSLVLVLPPPPPPPPPPLPPLSLPPGGSRQRGAAGVRVSRWRDTTVSTRGGDRADPSRRGFPAGEACDLAGPRRRGAGARGGQRRLYGAHWGMAPLWVHANSQGCMDECMDNERKRPFSVEAFEAEYGVASSRFLRG
ncbi:mitochondrial fission regulator 2-like [Penaeus chinensis]|uniref:mitochondrial fission regulator 2-like n=1 Tax=Penaeus chinensis TaxID=139456 RepID=UPI001FB6BF27|nr:mitochondrial fission regulator 2-like [Penaeus chinensis]